MVRIEETGTLGPEIGPLAAEAGSQGFAFMERLQRDWAAGANRFDREGEAYYTALLDGRLVGIGGLNQDPYLGDPAIGRVRHLYVLADFRRAGIGRALVDRIVARARECFVLLRLRTTTPAGAMFYERLGFHAVEGKNVSHVLDLANPDVPRFG